MPKLLVTADWHLRPDRPRCRLDENWWASQCDVVDFIIDTTRENKALLCIVGDIFHRPQVPDYIKTFLLERFQTYDTHPAIVPGQHDLPYHEWRNVNHSSFGVLLRSGYADFLTRWGRAAAFGQEVNETATGDRDILFIHTLTFKETKDIPPKVSASTAQDLLNRYPWAKWIFTGDNHHHFHYEWGGRHVINSGCITIQAADMAGYQPVVYVVDTNAETVAVIDLPNNTEIITDAYLRKEEEREDRIHAFVETIRGSTDVSLNFSDNLDRALTENQQLRPGVVRSITELVNTAQGEIK